MKYTQVRNIAENSEIPYTKTFPVDREEGMDSKWHFRVESVIEFRELVRLGQGVQLFTTNFRAASFKKFSTWSLIRRPFSSNYSSVKSKSIFVIM